MHHEMGTTTKIVTVANQKGGVGKTTTVANLATSLVSIGQRVLIVDFDPQGNISTGFGISKSQRKITIYDILCGADINGSEVKTKIENLEIITATPELAAAEIEIATMENRHMVLKKKLLGLKKKYDFIFIDCPPSLGMLTVNAMVASNSIIVPVQCEFFALEGLSHFVKTYEAIKRNFNPTLQIEGILLTMFDARQRLSDQVVRDVRRHFVGKEKVYKTIIPRNVKVAEAPSHGKPVLLYAFDCIASQRYIELAKEVIAANNIFVE